jgi:hypothetical protein
MCSSGSGNFYHLAMCDPDWRTSREEHIEPPLGWVLWLPSRRQIREVLEVCGNNDEMGRLIEKMVPQAPGSAEVGEALVAKSISRFTAQRL